MIVDSSSNPDIRIPTPKVDDVDNYYSARQGDYSYSARTDDYLLAEVAVREEEWGDAFYEGVSEDEEEAYHDVPQSNALDIQAFEIVQPASHPGYIQVPLWIVSVQGFRREPLRANDEKFLNETDPEFKEAVLMLTRELDPLDMDVPLPTLSTSWFRALSNFLAHIINIFILHVANHFIREWRRFKEELEALRRRDIPGYVGQVGNATYNNDVESIAELPIPTYLPSVANLQKLLVFNRFACQYGWYATLIRVERTPPGSRVIGFRLQLTRISTGDHSSHEPVVARQASGSLPVVSFAELLSREGSLLRKTMHKSSIAEEDHSRKEESGSTAKQNKDGLFSSLLHHLHIVGSETEAGTPPLLVYSINGEPDMTWSSSEVISYAASLKSLFGISERPGSIS